ncbi:hypothetical protein FE257_002928 [Aspergillus nanangensis]|uniref:Uncharacterized protein n=1 Tax=Aspergillus nanangensis TaxID=2582783 RepID=A0AAD4CSM6_ASPNN|nr:hypothetical protein FE257_002928 [Aspergillus nanangensis]
MFHDPAPQQEVHIILSARQALSLVWAILSLKCLHALAIIFTTQRRTARAPNPNTWIHQAITHREKQIIHFFHDIISNHEISSSTANATGPPLLCVQSATSADTEPPRPHVPNPKFLTIEEVNHPSQMDDTGAPMTTPLSAICISPSGGLDLDGGPTTAEQEQASDLRRTAISDSVYTMPGRSVSPSRIQSRSSAAPLMAAAQYADILSKRPRFSTSPPFSLDSMTIPLSTYGAPLDMEDLSQSQSAESFPGKFPVSDGLEFCSLATPHCIRGRGAISVRPFSDM